MIVHLSGTLILKAIDYIVIDVQGVGYQVFTSSFNHHQEGDPIEIWTYHHVGSDSQHYLYGLPNQESYLLFKQFLKVQGVGPKIALKIVESDTPENIRLAILNKDLNFFTRVKGLGKKGAQKILLELKNILVETDASHSGVQQTVIDALTSLGFTHQEIDQALRQIKVDHLSDSEAIEKILQYLGS